MVAFSLLMNVIYNNTWTWSLDSTLYTTPGPTLDPTLQQQLDLHLDLHLEYGP
jgi:hypothetical protein